MDWECETCDRQFVNEHAVNQHMDALDHWGPRWDCENPSCSFSFRNPQAARAHMDNSSHWRKHYCQPCERGFQNENNLNQHLRSRAHRPTGIPCPFCRTDFVTASGVAHHIETGSCPHARTLNREQVYRFIRERDTQGIIVKKFLTWNDEQPSQMSATMRTWNGRAFECYMCHRTFAQLPYLNQHLSSPAHKQKIYHCPQRSCSKDFVSLAALFNHIESESCGYARFDAVQASLQGLITGGQQKLLDF